MGSHNPPPLGASVLAGTRFLLQSMWDPQSTLLWDPEFLLAHRLMSTPFEAQPLRWHNARSLALIPFVTVQSPLAYIVLFGFSLSCLSSKFPHPYVRVFVLLPNRCRISQLSPYKVSQQSSSRMALSTYKMILKLNQIQYISIILDKPFIYA